MNRESKRDPTKDELIEVSLKILYSTDRALLVTEGLEDKDGRVIKHWLPKSQIPSDYDETSSEVQTIPVPRWLIEEKGLTID